MIIEVDREDLLVQPEPRISADFGNIIVFLLKSSNNTPLILKRGVFKYKDEFYAIKSSELQSATPTDFMKLLCQYTNKPDDA